MQKSCVPRSFCLQVIHTRLFLTTHEVTEPWICLSQRTFKVVERAERKGHNPQTRAEITIPARQVVKFVVSKTLKDAIN
ncbi:MAG: HU family DNA-binding protein [Desulfovibrionaceae bacterium]|nr:HU family DNA-binding protein [Desulfovibrionaceae bacterium]